jgi:hypothetical protein
MYCNTYINPVYLVLLTTEIQVPKFFNQKYSCIQVNFNLRHWGLTVNYSTGITEHVPSHTCTVAIIMKYILKATKMTSVMQAGEQTVEEGTKGK